MELKLREKKVGIMVASLKRIKKKMNTEKKKSKVKRKSKLIDTNFYTHVYMYRSKVDRSPTGSLDSEGGHTGRPWRDPSTSSLDSKGHAKKDVKIVS